MRNSDKKKKIFRFISFALLAVVFLVFSAPAVLAQTTPPQPITSNAGSALQATLNLGVGVPALAIVSALAIVLDFIATWILGWSTDLLDSAINWNFTLAPADISAVLTGWTIFRDMANGLFILVILWIALTIVLNIEGLGGRKMLFKVVVSATLINFSLLLVTLVFAFTNLLSAPFVKALPHNANGEIAVGTYINTLLASQAIYKAVGQEEKAVAAQIKPPPGPGVEGPRISDTLFASIGINNAKASAVGRVICGMKWMFNPSYRCSTGEIAGGWIGSLADNIEAANIPFKALLQATQIVVIGLLYHLLAATAMLLGALALVVRVFSMIVLSIFAPLIFLIYALPMKIGQEILNKWLKRLVSDAFFAPIFFFLFYISILIMELGFATFIGKGVNPVTDLNVAVTLVLSVSFMVFAIIFAKKAGGAVTETAISLGKGALGLAAAGAAAAATGGASLAVTGARTGAAITGAAEKLQARPILGRLTKPLTERTLAFAEEQRSRADKRQKEIKSRSDDLLVSGYKSATMPYEKMAFAKELAERGKLDKLAGRERELLTISKGFNEQEKILKTRPDLATTDLVAGTTNITEAKQKIIEKIKPNELANMAVGALVDPEIVDLLVKTMSPEHWRQLARSSNQELFRNLQEKINLRPEVVENMKPEAYRYLTSNAAQGMGLTLPATAPAPHALNIEEFQEADRRVAEITRQIQDLELKAQDLTNIGQDKKAREIRGVQIPELERKRNDIGLHGLP